MYLIIINKAREYELGHSEAILYVNTKIPSLSDIGLWTLVFTTNVIDHLVSLGPHQIKDGALPKDNTGRRFSSAYFYRNLKNAERLLCR